MSDKSQVVYDTSNELEQQAWVAHKLQNNPAMASMTGLLSSFPVIKVFTSNAVPLLIWREKRNAAGAIRAQK